MRSTAAQALIGVIRTGRGEAAVWPALDSAIAKAAPTGHPQYVVPTRLARAEAFLTEGRVDEARHEAELARQKLRQIGARSVPVGPHRATRSHPLVLTPRECKVLELISERQSIAEIARTLFISAKTVDHHVSAVLAKLGVDNREAAADMSRKTIAG